MTIQSITKNTLTEDIFHLGVKTIIYNTDGNILILKVHKGTKQYWDLPGGRVQIGEHHEQTALREIREETGITHINNMRHVGMGTSHIRVPLDNNHSAGLIFSFYMGTVQNTQVTLSSEHQDFTWITPEDAIRLLEPVYGTAFTACIKHL